MLSRTHTALWFSLGLLAVALLGGCRATDPLDVKVSAKNSNDYDEWVEKRYSRLPEGIAQEYAKAFTAIRLRAPRAGTHVADLGARDGTTYIFGKINGRTVREVIAEGYALANTSLQYNIANELDNVKRATERAEQADEKEAKMLQERVEARLALIEKMRIQIATNKEMIARYAPPK